MSNDLHLIKKTIAVINTEWIGSRQVFKKKNKTNIKE